MFYQGVPVCLCIPDGRGGASYRGERVRGRARPEVDLLVSPVTLRKAEWIAAGALAVLTPALVGIAIRFPGVARWISIAFSVLLSWGIVEIVLPSLRQAVRWCGRVARRAKQ